MLTNQVLNVALYEVPLPVSVALSAGEWIAACIPEGVLAFINADGTGTVYEDGETVPEISEAKTSLSVTFNPTSERVYTDSLEVDSYILPIEGFGMLSYKYVTFNYKATYGGSITGDTEQVIMAGITGAQVTAVPIDGYTFLKWSDNVTTASRTDIAGLKGLNVTALFYKTSDYSSIIYQYK